MLLLLLQVAAAHPTAPPNDTLAAKVDQIFAEWNKPGSPGCALGIVRDGSMLYRKGYGVQSLATRLPLTTASVFYAASVSKQFAAASVVLAARDGRLSLDDPVQKWVPELPAYGKPVTVGHLIHHTSGLRDYLTLWGLSATLGAVHSDSDLVGLLGRQRALNFDPGAEFSYSNSGYVLLSYIIKRATAKSLREFAQERIFGPLAMRSTHFHDDRAERHDPKTAALGYQKDEKGPLRPGLLPNFDKVGDGGLYTTVEDLFRWDQNFYTRAVGGDGFWDQMLTRGTLADGDTINYAFALVVDDYKGLRTVEHEGSFMGYRNDLLRFPDQRFSVICLCNLGTIDPGALARKIADLYLAEDFRKRLERFAGEYSSDELGATLQVVRRGGDLFLRRPGAPDAVLTGVRREYGARTKEAGDQFTFDSGLDRMSAKFISDSEGRVTALLFDAGRAKNLRFVRK